MRGAKRSSESTGRASGGSIVPSGVEIALRLRTRSIQHRCERDEERNDVLDIERDRSPCAGHWHHQGRLAQAAVAQVRRALSAAFAVEPPNVLVRLKFGSGAWNVW